MPFQNHFQNAYVTRSRESALDLMRDRYGVGEFVTFEVDMDMQTPDGPRRSTSKAALGWVGGFNIEIIEPVGGEIDVYSDFLPAGDTPRFHHICMRSFDWNATREDIARRGWPIAFEGHMDGLKFVYVDVREELGHYLEYLWATAEMWRFIGGPE